jgi:hypothetical protein
VLLEQLRDAEFLEKNANVADRVGASALGVAVLAFRHGLFPQPAHIIEQDLLIVPALVDIRNATMLDKRINCSSIVADVSGSRPRASQLAKYFSAAVASVILPEPSNKTTVLSQSPFR